MLFNIYSNSMDFGLFLDFKSVTRNGDSSQPEVSKNGLHMSDANVKPVVTSQMAASGTCTCMCDKHLFA